MFEESPDGFIHRWREYAAAVRIFSRTEGLPLLEAEVAGAILQMLERTGPYQAPPGLARLIVNPTAQRLAPAGGERKLLEVAGIGQARIQGQIVLRDDPFLVVDAGAPLVVGVLEPIPREAIAGAWINFESVPPIHAFVLREARAPVLPSANGEAI